MTRLLGTMWPHSASLARERRTEGTLVREVAWRVMIGRIMAGLILPGVGS